MVRARSWSVGYSLGLNRCNSSSWDHSRIQFQFVGISGMASTTKSTFAKILVAAIAVSSMGVAMAASAPAPAPMGESTAAGLMPTTVLTTLAVAITGFFAARCL
ncbi:hypothetical protein R1flu_024950 [Riccia fluitans]|uniref:Uncharacterized protein n=1 Tax=Riccia fluitans TaxID=41844 RepID=A0ABD1Y0F7_9MARC